MPVPRPTGVWPGNSSPAEEHPERPRSPGRSGDPTCRRCRRWAVGTARRGDSTYRRETAPTDEEAAQGFPVELEDVAGPFALLLGLISKRRLDVTEIALAEVTDEFIAYTTELKDQTNLAEISQFLLVAATLLDLKTARLLPHEEGEEVLDL